MGDGTTRQGHLSCSSPTSSAGRPSPGSCSPPGIWFPHQDDLVQRVTMVVMRAPEQTTEDPMSDLQAIADRVEIEALRGEFTEAGP